LPGLIDGNALDLPGDQRDTIPYSSSRHSMAPLQSEVRLDTVGSKAAQAMGNTLFSL
jgi:hypothetical protein